MSGPWIPVEHATARKPEILELSELLSIHPDQAFGLCFRFWCWCDSNLETGNASRVTLSMLDTLLERNGFAAALVKVGWLRVRDGSLEVPNYDRHLSKNAKKRALSRNRVADMRKRNCNVQSVTPALPHNSTRTVQNRKKKTPLPPLPEPDVPDSLKPVVTKWLEYKRERRENYKPTGLETLMATIREQAREHGEAEVSRRMNAAMSNNHQGWNFSQGGRNANPKPDRDAGALFKDGDQSAGDWGPRRTA